MNIPTDVAEWRKAQRTELLSRRLAAPAEDRHRWIETITDLLEHGFPVLQKMVVGFCWPYKGEFDARFAIRFLRERGASAALPAVIKPKAPLQFREWWPGVAMTPGVFELPVPDNTRILVPDALLIPPVGFGEQGDRLGYGGGFFDRTLAAIAPQPLKIAVAFELSRIPTTYPQPHDVLMDFVVTELGIYAVANGKLQPIDVNECAALSRQIASERLLPRQQEN
jgi:5-formyltetrahydrofolate cyclo-ligase